MKTLAIALVASLSVVGSVAAEETIRFEVASPGSTAFIIATHLASVLDQRHGYQVEVATGFPGVRAMVNVAEGAAALSTYSPALVKFLSEGTAMFAQLENHTELADTLRPLFTTEGDLFTYGTYDPDIRNLGDIEGRRVFLGPQGAATIPMLSAQIEAATGLVANEDYELVHVDWPGSPALLQDGVVDVLVALCAVGCARWSELSTGRQLHLIGYTEEQAANAAFQAEMDFPGRRLTPVEPSAFGPDIVDRGPVLMVAESTGILASIAMSDEVAYNITRAFWETREDLASVAPFAAGFRIEDASFGMIAPIHPGAARYLTEEGVEIEGQN